MMETIFSVKTKMTRKIMCDYQKVSRQGNGKGWLRTLLWIFVVAFAAGTVPTWIAGEKNRIPYTIVTLLLLAFQLFEHRFAGWRAFRGYNSAVGEITYQFAEGHIDILCSLEESRTQYSAFVRLLENRNYYFLYVQKNVAHVLPKQDFVCGNPSDFGIFITEKTGLKLEHVKG